MFTGGGYLVGQLNNAGQLTGRDISFIYPDLDTGITGRDIVIGDYINTNYKLTSQSKRSFFN